VRHAEEYPKRRAGPSAPSPYPLPQNEGEGFPALLSH